MIRIAFIFLISLAFQASLIAQGYDKIYNYQDGAAKVKQGDYFGLIDSNGNEILPPKYDVIQSFNNFRAKISKDKLWGMVDNKGKILIPVTYENI